MSAHFLVAPILHRLQATTLADVQLVLSAFAMRWSFPTYLLIATIEATNKVLVPRMVTNAAADFLDAYLRNAWVAVDQIAEAVKGSTIPMRFDLERDWEPGNEWAQAVCDYQLNRGICIPLPAPERQSLVLQLHRPDIASMDEALLVEMTSEAIVLLNQLYPSVERMFTMKTSQLPPLTPIERSVLALLANGKALKVIAGTLGQSMKSISNHVHSICSKYRVPTREQALVLAASAGIVTTFRSADDQPSLEL